MPCSCLTSTIGNRLFFSAESRMRVFCFCFENRIEVWSFEEMVDGNKVRGGNFKFCVYQCALIRNSDLGVSPRRIVKYMVLFFRIFHFREKKSWIESFYLNSLQSGDLMSNSFSLRIFSKPQVWWMIKSSFFRDVQDFFLNSEKAWQ